MADKTRKDAVEALAGQLFDGVSVPRQVEAAARFGAIY